MQCNRIIFTGHALKRMFERRLTDEDVREAIRNGEIIEEYPDDSPFPSTLILGFSEARAIHIVVGLDISTGTCYVITVYGPDPNLWDSKFRTRRNK
jgi:hypothetical protein